MAALCCSVVAMTTSRPSTESELQQYRVLERANLLQYYDTFISQGTILSLQIIYLTILMPDSGKQWQVWGNSNVM